MMKQVFSLMVNGIKGYEKGKQQLFNFHVEPIQEKINEIHKDYLTSFMQVRKSLDKEEVPTLELLNFLEERRNELLTQRELTKALAVELQNADRRLVGPKAWQYFNDYCKSVEDYFNAGNAPSRFSWYSDFIRFMKSSRQANLQDIYFSKLNGCFGNDPRQDLIAEIDVVLTKKLPEALKQVHTNYAKLRSSLL
ncbi:hypothetical protein ACP6IB_26990 [Vibrio harveyi]|uniref:hypothetical protein n=1 Tax=Vibrio harveyi TaxID=669 RepID=UPI0018F2135F|nr:hypothetical protein [Vibrio harveyi]EKO3802557.1 hypothetical protein [Vibrio harveyi]